MEHDGALTASLRVMKENGADRAQALLALSEKCELNVDADEISLLRTTTDARLTLTAIADGRKGSVTVNRVDPQGVEQAAAQAVAYARASPPDPAHDISPLQPAGRFSYGATQPDRSLMYQRLEAFLARARKLYPHTRLEQCILDFTATRSVFLNTNGASFQSDTGVYTFDAMFTTKEGRKTTSFNGAGAVRRELDAPLERWGSVDELMRQSTEQLDPGSVEGKFVGDVIITPDCLGDFIEGISSRFLSDQALIRATSPLKDSLGQRVAAPLFTLRSSPVSADIHAGYFFTPDGFRAGDSVLIDKGVLAGYNLSLYGARKTGREKAPNAGGCWVVDPGDAPFAEMLSSVRRGLLLCRFSGGNPSSNGDFTGVAKNSYLIENGSIARPVTETMVGGNLLSLLQSISAVSRERVDFGTALFPWVRAGGVTISGKQRDS
jgi:PmbA protein